MIKTIREGSKWNFERFLEEKINGLCSLYLRDHLLILCYILSVELSVFDGNVDYISHLLDRALSKCSTVLEKSQSFE